MREKNSLGEQASTASAQNLETSIGATADEDDQRSIDATTESRKRLYEGLDQLGGPEDGNMVEDSVTSTPRKRKRRGRRAKHDNQEVIEFLPAGGSFNQGYIPGEDLQGGMPMKTGFNGTAQSEGYEDLLASGGDEEKNIESTGEVGPQDDVIPIILREDKEVQTESKGNGQILSKPHPDSSTKPETDYWAEHQRQVISSV